MGRRLRRIALTVGAVVVVLAAAARIAVAVLYGRADLDTTGRVDFSRPLKVPPPATSRIDEQGRRVFDLTARPGRTEFRAGVATETYGINGSYLGPTLRARHGERVLVNLTNARGEPTTMHRHGMHLPARMDGGPHQVIAPGSTWSPTWDIDQQAATLWYHPHVLTDIPRLSERDAVRTRTFELHGRTVNGRKMDMDRIDQTVQAGSTEIWKVTNTGGIPHSFHVPDRPRSRGGPRRDHRRDHHPARAVAPFADLGPGRRDGPARAAADRHRPAGLRLRPAKPVAARHQREHQRAAAPVLPHRDRPRPAQPGRPRSGRRRPEHPPEEGARVADPPRSSTSTRKLRPELAAIRRSGSQ